MPPFGGPARFIGAVFGFVFCGIGLAILGFMWTVQGSDEPPLFFKIFASFIALPFVAMGGTLFFTSLKRRSMILEMPTIQQSPPATAAGKDYACPSCGARLGEDVDVSPSGDAKCGYCRKWFNIHG